RLKCKCAGVDSCEDHRSINTEKQDGNEDKGIGKGKGRLSLRNSYVDAGYHQDSDQAQQDPLKLDPRDAQRPSGVDEHQQARNDHCGDHKPGSATRLALHRRHSDDPSAADREMNIGFRYATRVPDANTQAKLKQASRSAQVIAGGIQRVQLELTFLIDEFRSNCSTRKRSDSRTLGLSDSRAETPNVTSDTLVQEN